MKDALYTQCKKSGVAFVATAFLSCVALAQDDTDPEVPSPSGSFVPNVATLTYAEFAVPGTQQQRNSNNADFFVDEIIDVEVVRVSDEPIQAFAGEQDLVHIFDVSNLGNGRENFHFILDAGGDLQPDSFRVFVEDDTPGFQGTEQQYTGEEGLELARAGQDGDSIRLLAVFNIPADAPIEADGVVRLTAVSTTALVADARAEPPGFGVDGQGSNEFLTPPDGNGNVDGNVDAVFCPAEASATGAITASNTTITARKESVVVDVDGGQRVESGSVITYTITVEVVGRGSTDNVVFTDNIPQFTSYQPNSIRLNGEARTDDASDADGADFNVTTLNAITVSLGSLVASDGPQTVQFSVSVN